MIFADSTVRFTLHDGETLADVQWQDTQSQSFIVVLTSTGRVLQRATDGSSQNEFRNVSAWIDLETPTKIYCDDCYISIVNERGENGIVLSSEDTDWALPLHREDYHSAHCPFPIAFISSSTGKQLIHATEWNRLDITDLATGRCLTDRVVQHEPNQNYLDYFLGRLHMAPDQQYFVSTGWVWHPIDSLYAWKLDRFRRDYEPGYILIEDPIDFDDRGCVFDRPLCFIDDKLVAWGCNPYEEVDDPDHHVASELVVSDVTTGKMVEKIPFDHFAFNEPGYREVCGTLVYDADSQSFITFSDKRDLVVTDRKGIEVGRKAIRPVAFSLSSLSALCISGLEVEITTLQFHVTF